MGAKQGKLMHIRVRPQPKYKCTLCKRKSKKKQLSYCLTCCEEHPDACVEAFSLCANCATCHDSSHVVLSKIPGCSKTKKKIRRMAEEADEMEIDLVAALSDVKEHVWKVEKIQKARITEMKEAVKKAETEINQKGKLCNATRGKLLKLNEETRLRNKILICRLKVLEESGENIFSANGSDLNYQGGMSIRDSLRIEIARQRRLGNYGGAMETINELLEATNGRITLRESQLLSRIVTEKIEQMNRVTDRMSAVDGYMHVVKPNQSSQQLLTGLLSNISCDFRTECAEMLDILTRIHSHADVNIKGYASRDIPIGVNTSIDYIMNLNPEDNLSLRYSKRSPNMQRFLDMKVVVIRYFLAISVCAVWLNVTSEDKEEYSDVVQQLRDCVDGFVYSARQAGWPTGHPLYSTLANLLIELGRKYPSVRSIKNVRRRVEKILLAAEDCPHDHLVEKDRECAENIEIDVRNGYEELWGHIRDD